MAYRASNLREVVSNNLRYTADTGIVLELTQLDNPRPMTSGWPRQLSIIRGCY